jgi:NAD(P)-dependent dehydrogenase (short-subunit alcohol dehydrogenase family)
MSAWQDRVALVTGGTSGIGLATAQRFAESGARVVIAGRTPETGEEAAQGIRKQGGDCVFVRADVADEAQVQALVDRCLELHGRLDCAFNNAGAEPQSRTARLHEYGEDDWREVVDAHLSGIFRCLKHEIAAMLPRASGAIVNMSSVYGVGADAIAYPSYVASKHGAIGLTRAAAMQYAKRGIRVNAVCPGVIRTAMLERAIQANPALEEVFRRKHPMARIGEPIEVAEAVLWLCSDASSFVTGHALAVDGGIGAAI